MTHFLEYPSPLGILLLTCSEEGLTGIWVDRQCPTDAPSRSHPILENTKLWLDAYFQGQIPQVSLPLAPEGTPCQRLVWDILLTIPYGETRSYGSIAREVAQQLGKAAMSAQAVGGAVGRNPISIVIPCHRCVGAKGQLTGYAGGLERKAWLLRHEGILP